MSPRRIRFGQLYNDLDSLGYRPEYGPTYVIYRKPGTRLPVILPKRPKSEDVPNLNLASVQHTLELDGVVETGHLMFSIDGVAPKRKTNAAKPKAKAAKAGGPEPSR